MWFNSSWKLDQRQITANSNNYVKKDRVIGSYQAEKEKEKMLNMFKSMIIFISVLSVFLRNPYLTTFNPTYFSIIVRNT